MLFKNPCNNNTFFYLLKEPKFARPENEKDSKLPIFGWSAMYLVSWQNTFLKPQPKFENF